MCSLIHIEVGLLSATSASIAFCGGNGRHILFHCLLGDLFFIFIQWNDIEFFSSFSLAERCVDFWTLPTRMTAEDMYYECVPCLSLFTHSFDYVSYI